MSKLIITGAGASAPYGFPTGSQLRNLICERIMELRQKDTWLADRIPYEENLKEFGRIFKNSGTSSIDLFLSRRKGQTEFEFIGKAAIAHFILQSENQNDLNSVLKDSDFDDWYHYLYNKLTEGCFSLEAAIEALKSVTFITFNYDRSFEYYMYRCLFNSFVAKLLRFEEELDFTKFPKLNIHHVYGSLGDIKTRNYPFGKKYQVRQEHLDGIKVLYDDRTGIPGIEGLIHAADTLYFLGFGFLPDNMNKLGIASVDWSKKRVFATGRGLLEAQIESARNLFPSNVDVRIQNVNCITLLKTYFDWT